MVFTSASQDPFPDAVAVFDGAGEVAEDGFGDLHLKKRKNLLFLKKK